MSFCNKCGASFSDSYKFCPNCGTPVIHTSSNAYSYSYGQQNANNGYSYNQGFSEKQQQKRSHCWLWGILSFFFPIVGLFLLIFWSRSKPKYAKAAGIGAIISLLLKIVSSVLYVIFVFVLASDIPSVETEIIHSAHGLETIWIMLSGLY